MLLFWWYNGKKINFSNVLLDKKIYAIISVYNNLYKTPTGPKPLHIMFDKIDAFTRALDGKNIYLILFDYGFIWFTLFDYEICDKITYLISEKIILQRALIIILERSEFNSLSIKKYWLFIML